MIVANQPQPPPVVAAALGGIRAEIESLIDRHGAAIGSAAAAQGAAEADTRASYVVPVLAGLGGLAVVGAAYYFGGRRR
jgi:hypothetical protein